MFPTQELGWKPISLCPLVCAYDGSYDTLPALPVELLLAEGVFSYYRL